MIIYDEIKRTLTIENGYYKRVSTGECFQGNKLYLGRYDSENDYEEITKEEYDEYIIEKLPKENMEEN